MLVCAVFWSRACLVSRVGGLSLVFSRLQSGIEIGCIVDSVAFMVAVLLAQGKVERTGQPGVAGA